MECPGVPDAGEVVDTGQPSLPGQRAAEGHDGPGQAAYGNEGKDDDRNTGAQNCDAPVARLVSKLH